MDGVGVDERDERVARVLRAAQERAAQSRAAADARAGLVGGFPAPAAPSGRRMDSVELAVVAADVAAMGGRPVVPEGVQASGSATREEVELVNRLRGLAKVECAVAAAKAKTAARLEAVVRDRHAREGLPLEKQGAGVARQAGLALRCSPHAAARQLGVGRALVVEMPNALVALGAGRISPRTAEALVRETACLAVGDRARVDEELCADPAVLEGLGERQAASKAKAAALALDPSAAVRRAGQAEKDRRVGLRPAPDTMASFSALLPAPAGVAVLKSLSEAADAARACGDGRSRGQVMADTLVERVTGGTTKVPARIEVQLVMTDRALIQGDTEPARLPGYGIVPAHTARDLIRHALAQQGQAADAGPASGSGGTSAPTSGSGPGSRPSGRDQSRPAAGSEGTSAPTSGSGPGSRPPGGDQARPAAGSEGTGAPTSGSGPGMGPPGGGQAGGTRFSAGDPDPGFGAGLVALRRLYTAPSTGQLVGLESRSRAFPAGLARFIALRDETCATPWCDAPIRHTDHVLPWAAGGSTSAANGQGLCEACNYAKEAPGHGTAVVQDASRHTTVTTTPTGHTYTQRAPALPGTPIGGLELVRPGDRGWNPTDPAIAAALGTDPDRRAGTGTGTTGSTRPANQVSDGAVATGTHDEWVTLRIPLRRHAKPAA